MLILPVGIPGCGKSTLGQMLVNAGNIKPDAVVNPDRYREILTGDRNNQEVNAEAWRITKITALTRLSYNQDVYLDATNVLMRNFTEYTAAAEQFGHKVCFVWFDNLVQARERNAKRAVPVPEHVMDRMEHSYKTLALATIPEWKNIYLHTDHDLFERLR